jgi:two-component system, OmpR family, alkaline phosphatase synthesis response regulator PhoP
MRDGGFKMTENSQKCKVLLVDDDEQILKSLKIYLELENYQVTTAENGREALDKVREDMPEIMVLDIMMPILDGYQVLEKLKEDPETSRLPVIMLTAKGQDIDVLKGYKMGASSYMTKPFNLNELVENIEMVLKNDLA